MEALADDILTWYAEGERGISSEAMAAIASGKKPKDRWHNHPHDPSDLNRCIKLVCAAPEVKNAFPQIASLSPYWAAIILEWDRLTNMFIDEVGYDWSKAKRAPKTYKTMNDMFEQVRKKEASQ